MDSSSTIEKHCDGLWLDTSRLHLFDPRSGTNITLTGAARTAAA